MDEHLIVIIIQILLVFSMITIITLFIRLNNAVKLEKRIAKYSVRYNKKAKNLSFFEKVWNKYIWFVKRQRKKIRKMLPTLVKRYDKYVLHEDVKAEDYVTHKFVIGFLLMLLGIIAMAIQGQVISMFQLLISFAIGFMLLDIGLVIEQRINRKKIENDILKAIIIMNNAFKSGKSTMQAVEIASKKLPGAIGLEFKKIYEEMQYGLSIETVFSRFSKRVKLEEAEYLASSLMILNRTGGNIVAVFNSIEKTLFDKKKLKEELKNSTTVSKLVVRLLLVVPIVFGLIVYMLNPSYFDPFFESTLGYVMRGIIFVMFIIYAYLLDRIVRVNY